MTPKKRQEVEETVRKALVEISEKLDGFSSAVKSQRWDRRVGVGALFQGPIAHRVIGTRRRIAQTIDHRDDAVNQIPD